MYAYISGTVAHISDGCVVIDNQGIGYRILVPGSVTDAVSVGSEERLYTYFSVREDAMQLFGFLTQDDLDMYKMLLGVSGIGPKGALGILSVMSADDLRFAILSDDAAGISKAPGIGKKTAQKVVLELKDKLDLEDAFEKKQANTEAKAAKSAGADSEAVMALTALGYSNSEAFKAVRKVQADLPDADTEALIKAALKVMYSGV